MNLRRVHLLHLLVLLTLLFGVAPWPAPRAVLAAPVTPTQSLRAQMHPASQQPLREFAASTRTDSWEVFGPPAWPAQAEAVAPATRSNSPGAIQAEPAAHTSTVAPSAQSTPTPQPTATDDSPTLPESRKRTQQNTAAQTRLYLPLLLAGGSAPTTEVLITPQGGQVRSPDGRIHLDVPAGAVSEDVWITLTQGGAYPPIGTRHSLGVFFTLTARTADGQPVTQFAQPLTLRVRYAQGAAIAGGTRGLFYYDEQQQLWQTLETSDDATAGLLVATTDHFTQFGAFATPAAGPCTPAPGEGADATAASAIKSTFEGLGLGCPDGVAYQWDGAWTQNYANGVVVYNGNSGHGVAYVVAEPYRQAYVNAGGPDGFLGLPIEHSTNASLPPDYYQDYSSNFTGTPIQKFERGFVGRNVSVQAPPVGSSFGAG